MVRSHRACGSTFARSSQYARNAISTVATSLLNLTGAGDGYTHVFVLLDDIELPPATFSLAGLLPHDATPLHMWG